MFSKLKKRDVAAELEKQTSTRSLLRFPKISFDRWRSAIITPDVKNDNSNNHGTPYITITPSLRKQPIIIQAQESKASIARRSSISRDRQPRSQERHLLATSTHSTNSSRSRSRSRSKLAFARSQSNPSYQRIIKINDVADYRKQETSVRYQQREPVENKDHETIEITRGRRNRQSSISAPRARRSEDRTPSPLHEPGLTPAGTPCSSRSLEPSTPVRLENDYQQIDAKVRPPIIMEISPNQRLDTGDVDRLSTVSSDFYAFPESYYKLHSLKYQGSNLDSIDGIKTQQSSRNDMNRVPQSRRLVIDPNLSDGSQLRSVSSGRAHIMANTSRISSVPILAEDPLVLQEPILSSPIAPSNEVSSHSSTYRAETLQSDNDESLESAVNPRIREIASSKCQYEPTNPDPLPRKPASFERLRPPLKGCQAELPSPPSEPRPSPRRTRSEAVDIEPPLMRGHTRSISTYSYIPMRDLRPERRSYNTVRLLNSQAQTHERLRRVLGV